MELCEDFAAWMINYIPRNTPRCNYIFMPYIHNSGTKVIYCSCGTVVFVLPLHINFGVPWASYQIRKIAGCACAGKAGNVFPRRRFQMKPLVSDPGMHHGTCMKHVPWCMSGSLTCGNGENVPGIPGACAPAISRIWQEVPCHQPVAYMGCGATP